MSNKEKGFNFKLYAVISFVAVAVALVVICVTTFSAKYIAFHPERLAEFYVDTIVQTGDGYNAYKNTLVSKEMKHGDFIRRNYIDAFVTREDTDYSDESFKGEKTLGDDGTLSGELIDRMYPVYKKLVDTYGWDDYNSIFKVYLKSLISAREEIFGDKFFNDEVFFTAFEANVSAYGKYLTGTEEVYDENSGVKLSDKTSGIYTENFGEDYRLVCKAVRTEEGYPSSYNQTDYSGIYETYGVSDEEFEDVVTVYVEVSLDGGEVLAECEVALVKIGMSWYVDNLNTNTRDLFMICR